MASRRVLLRIEQDPDPPSRWARRTGIVLGQTPVQIGCLADVGSIAVSAPPIEDVNEAFHGINFAGAVAVVVDPTERRRPRSNLSRKTYTGFASISTATSSAGSLPLFTHAWLVPRWITTSNGF